MEDETPKRRNPNFSTGDCLLLTELMGAPSPMPDMSRHVYLRHRFNTNITSQTKRNLWREVSILFSARADFPRLGPDVQKKWDSLVSRHRNAYSDFRRESGKTGGGSCRVSLQPLTDAIMSVVGKTATSTVGVGGIELDSTMQQLEPAAGPIGNSAPISSFPEYELPSIEPAAGPTGTFGPFVQEYQEPPSKITKVCCLCECHNRLDGLKEEKLKLQIKLLKQQLQ